jgi:uncharacterized protein YjbJ (UPF0337 family)
MLARHPPSGQMNCVGSWRPTAGHCGNLCGYNGLSHRQFAASLVFPNDDFERKTHMNQDQAGGKWKQFKGKVKEQWGKLTDDDLQMVEGKQDQLIGRLQERYGIAKDEAERQLRDFQTKNRDFTWQ